MKRGIKWFIAVLLVGVVAFSVLNYPIITYKARTNYKNYSIYHNQRLDTNLIKRLDEVTPLLKKSELYDSTYRLHVCLNDGSWYPKIIKTIQIPNSKFDYTF